MNSRSARQAAQTPIPPAGVGYGPLLRRRQACTNVGANIHLRPPAFHTPSVGLRPTPSPLRGEGARNHLLFRLAAGMREGRNGSKRVRATARATVSARLRGRVRLEAQANGEIVACF